MAQKDLTIKLAPDLTFRIRFDAESALDRYSARLAAFDRNAGNMEPAFKRFGVYMMRSVARNFAAEGRPARWRALKEATIKERMRLGYGRGPILQRTGALKRSIRYEAKTKFFVMRSDSPYFNAHQYGYRPRNLPARPMVRLLAQDKAQFTKIYKQHLGVE